MATVTHRLRRSSFSSEAIYNWIGTVDHKKIGRRYLVTAFGFLTLGGIEALVMRAQLALPGMNLLSPEAYNQFFSMHGVTMIFWYAAPILAGFGNYLIPLMIGTRDMAFPRLNAFSYWAFLFSGILLYISPFLGAMPNGGWFAFVPFTTREFSPGPNMDFYSLALLFLTISTTAGAINFIATIFRLRAPGMSINRLPLFGWSTLTTSFVIVFALPSLTVALVFLELDRLFATHFFDATAGGDPLLWQHLFWIFGHPWVYIIFLPATGMISMIVPTFSRRPIVGYVYVALATVLTGLLGFGVWVHHMFATGLPQISFSFFSAVSMTIALATTVQVFAWIATVWKGRPVLTTSMLFALGFIFLLVIGGLSGVMTAVVPFDWQAHDTYFVVGHIHYVLIGANLFPVIAAFYYWLPKITGRMMDERLGRWNFWTMFIGFNVGFFTMHITGLLGMPRRIFTFPPDVGWNAVNLITSIGVYIFAIGLLIGVVNFFRSLRTGAPADRNPWNAESLEWASESPPPEGNFERIPTVRSRHPIWDPHDEMAEESGARSLASHHEVITTTALDGAPLAVAHMPSESLMPLVLTLVITIAFLGVVFGRLWLSAAAVAVSLAVTAIWLWPKQGEMAA